MIKADYLNVIDYGSSKKRIALFDANLNICYSETIQNTLPIEDNNLNDLKETIKKGEKKISSHIKDIILLLDCQKTLIIDISLQKKLDQKSDFTKNYNFLIQETDQLISNNYSEYKLIHIFFNKAIIDEKLYNIIPKNLKFISEIKIDFKIICFPRKIIQKIEKNLNENNLNISKIYCTSYLKSLSYLNKLNIDKLCFLDIGFERTSFMFYENNKLKYIETIDIGSYHISKDISKIFKISIQDAEKIKKSFNKSETEFSYDNSKNNDILSIKDIIVKNISIDLLKKVILHRVQELIDLTYKKSKINNFEFKDAELFLIGDGSILFKNNSFYLNDKFNFKSINYFNETDLQICNSGAIYFINNQDKPKIVSKKQGFFEKFFNIFDK